MAHSLPRRSLSASPSGVAARREGVPALREDGDACPSPEAANPQHGCRFRNDRRADEHRGATESWVRTAQREKYQRDRGGEIT